MLFRSQTTGAYHVKTGIGSVTNCLFYNNSSSSYGGALVTETVTANLTITNCTIYGNSATTAAGGIGSQAGTINLNNSIIWGNISPDGAQIKNAGSAIVINNSDYRNDANDISGSITPTACINTYPVFVNEAGNDFKLGGNSPCLDAGNNGLCSETLDIRGSGYSRKLNKTNGSAGTIDMGAYEYKFNADPNYVGPENPAPFSATAFNSVQINLAWSLNANNDDVVVAWNTSNTFGTPSGTYAQGNSISGGGTVLYVGNNTSYNHLLLSPSTHYYYKIWSISDYGIYSTGLSDDDITPACINTNPVISGNNYFCFGGSTTLNAGSFSSYLWTGGNSTQTKSVNTAGTYTVTVTDANGCISSTSMAVTGNPQINITPTIVNVTCYGSNTGSVAIATSGGTPGYTYLWNTGNAGTTLVHVYAGNYTVTATDTKGCNKTITNSVTQPSSTLTITISKTNVRCGGKSTGTATATASGGSGGYSYLWENSSTNASRSNLPQGTYTVTVTDINGCSKSRSLAITQNTALSVVISGSGSTATANPSGGVDRKSTRLNSSHRT